MQREIGEALTVNVAYNNCQMRYDSIQNHLTQYSIYARRKTTINHAFASAIAPVDKYDQEIVREAMISLVLDPDNLGCIYCGNDAETWDHLVGLVQKGQLRGYGHQIGNLVPSCKSCNSKKGSKDWRLFIQQHVGDAERQRKVQERLEQYQRTYAKHVDVAEIEECSSEAWRRYEDLKQHILELMREADEVARILRTDYAEHRDGENAA